MGGVSVALLEFCYLDRRTFSTRQVAGAGLGATNTDQMHHSEQKFPGFDPAAPGKILLLGETLQKAADASETKNAQTEKGEAAPIVGNLMHGTDNRGSCGRQTGRIGVMGKAPEVPLKKMEFSQVPAALL